MMWNRRTLALVIAHEEAAMNRVPHAQPSTAIEREIPDELHELASVAEPLIDDFEDVKQDGEWKRHQVYAKMLKTSGLGKDEKWKAAFAIELAIAQRRMNA